MSKSLGNVYTLPELLQKGYRPSALRYLLLSSHYRKQLNFTWAGMEQAEESLRRLADFVARLDAVTEPGRHDGVQASIVAARARFTEAMQDDLNTAAALAAVFDLVRDVNSALDAHEAGAEDAAATLAAIRGFDQVLGVLVLRQAEDATPPVPVEEIERLIGERQAARRQRNFAEADRIRIELQDRGILLEDGPAGTRWKRR